MLSINKYFQSLHTIKKNRNLILIPFLLFFLLISVFSVRGKHATTDEPNHYRYGANILNGDAARYEDSDMSKMPISAWNALPAKIASFLPDGTLRIYLEKEIIARLMTILFSLIVAIFVFRWSLELYGWIPALASLTLYTFDPNIIAHSQLVTTDLYAAGALLFSAYWLWRFSKSRKWQDGLWFSVTLGFAQIAKYTLITLYPIFAATLLLSDLPSIIEQAKASGKSVIFSQTGRYIKYALIAGCIGILVINIGFLFERTFFSIKDYQFRSDLFTSLQNKINIVIPTPYSYLDGFDWIIFDERTSGDYGNIYLLGQTSEIKGFKGYYFIASAVKMPIASQIVLWAALAVYFTNKQKRQKFMQDELFLLCPALFYALYFNFLYNAQTGIRYYLIIYPLLYVFAGSLFREWSRFSRARKILSGALALYLAASVLSYYPNYLAYFNEIVWDRKMAYQYLADSNIEWGQDTNILKEYRAARAIDKAPEIPYPLTEKTTFILSVNELTGVSTTPANTYAWLRENFKPTGMIAPSYLLFEITPEQMRHLCSTTDYCQ